MTEGGCWMSIQTAVSLGVGLYKHRQAIGAALTGLNQLSGGKLDKIAQNFHLPPAVSQQIASSLHAAGSQSLASKSINSLQALANLGLLPKP